MAAVPAPAQVPRRWRYKLHPQPTSLELATKAAKAAGLRGEVVLDPFCGTGACLVAAVRARAELAVGSDLEDWSAYLRPELATMLACGSPRVRVLWGLDALEAVERVEHDVLFADPPNPWAVCGGCWVTVLRDLGLTFYDLRRYWLRPGRLNPGNLMGTGGRAVAYLVRLVKRELARGRRVVLNLFSAHGDVVRTRGRRSLLPAFSAVFELRRLGVGYWHEVTGVRP